MEDVNAATTATNTAPKKEGAFVESLNRNNKEIRKARAEGITEDLELMYSRKIQDFRKDIRTFDRDLEDMLDMSPTNKQSLILASDFKAEDFTNERIRLMVEKRNLEIKLELAERDFEYLLGKKCP